MTTTRVQLLGRVDVTFTNVTNFYVGGNAVTLKSSVWLYRATLDTTAAGNWSVLLPTIAQATQAGLVKRE